MKKSTFCNLLAAFVVIITTLASSMPAFAADGDDKVTGDATIKWARQNEDGDTEYGDPVVSHFFKDLKSVKFEDAIKVDEMAEFDAFEGIAKEGGKFKPNATMTRKQFRRIIRNLFDINIKITEPEKPVTRAWVKKQMDKLYVRFDIPKTSELKGSKKMTRLEGALEIYELYSQFEWSFEIGEVVIFD